MKEMVAVTNRQMMTPAVMFGETVSSSETVRRHFCSYKINDASLSRLEYLKRQLLFIHHT
jgi:hypothetical protein